MGPIWYRHESYHVLERLAKDYFLDLLSSKEPQKVEVAVETAEALIRSQPYDLKEVRTRT